MSKIIYYFIFAAILFCDSNVWCSNYIEMYNSVIFKANSEDNFIYDSNMKGEIVWKESYVMESLLNVFNATKNTIYLDEFLKHSSNITNTENSKSNRIDEDGKVRKGWQTNYQYTFSKPVILVGKNGRPVLKVIGKRWGQNNFTSIKINRTNINSYNLYLENRKSKFNVTFKNLNQKNVEAKVNGLANMANYIFVEKLGDDLPKTTDMINFESQRVTLTTFHNPKILAPILRFVYLVEKFNIVKYKSKSQLLLEFAQNIINSYDSLFREPGYYINEYNIPFASAGLPVPFNILADHGRCFLYLYLISPDIKYQNRLTKIIDFIETHFYIINAKWLINYAFGDYYNGWSNSATYNYKNYSGSKQLEDNSHFCSTLYFISELFRNKILSEDEAGPFDKAIKKIFLQSQKKQNISQYIDGSGEYTYNFASAFYIVFAPKTGSMYSNCENIFNEYYSKKKNISAGDLLAISNYILFKTKRN